MNEETQQKIVDEVTTADDLRDDLSIGKCTVPHLGNTDKLHYAVFAGDPTNAPADCVKAITGVVGAGDDAQSIKYARLFAMAPKLAAAGATLAFMLRGLIESANVDPHRTAISLPEQPGDSMTLADAIEHFDAVFAAAHNIRRAELIDTPVAEATVQ